MPGKPDILVIGIGNPYRYDDGVGFFVIDLLQKMEIDAEIRRVKPDGYSLLETWKGRELVIIIDAARGMGPAGTIRFFDALKDKIHTKLSPVSSHSLSLPETISLGLTLDQLPEKLLVFAIEAGYLRYGTDLSPDVETAGVHVTEQIREIINEYPDTELNIEKAENFSFTGSRVD